MHLRFLLTVFVYALSTTLGTAVVFFPATLDGVIDPLLLHATEPAVDTKWVCQIWIRQGAHHGIPPERIPDNKSGR